MDKTTTVKVPIIHSFLYVDTFGNEVKASFKIGDLMKIVTKDTTYIATATGISRVDSKPVVNIYSVVNEGYMDVVALSKLQIPIDDIMFVEPVCLEYIQDKDRHKTMAYDKCITFEFDGNKGRPIKKAVEYGEFVCVLISDKVVIGKKKKYFGHLKSFNKETGVISMIAYTNYGSNLKTRLVTIDIGQLLNIFKYKCNIIDFVDKAAETEATEAELPSEETVLNPAGEMNCAADGPMECAE